MWKMHYYIIRFIFDINFYIVFVVSNTEDVRITES